MSLLFLLLFHYYCLSFALWKDTADEIFFKNAPVGSSTWRAYQKIKKDDTFVHSGEEGLQMILNDPKVSIVGVSHRSAVLSFFVNLVDSYVLNRSPHPLKDLVLIDALTILVPSSAGSSDYVEWQPDTQISSP